MRIIRCYYEQIALDFNLHFNKNRKIADLKRKRKRGTPLDWRTEAADSFNETRQDRDLQIWRMQLAGSSSPFNIYSRDSLAGEIFFFFNLIPNY